MGMGISSGYGAAAGGDALQKLLKRKFMEQLQTKKMAEDIRQANMQNDIAQGQLGQGQQRIGLEGQRMAQEGAQFGQRLGLDTRHQDASESQFAAGAPLRLAQTGHLTAETADLQRKPAAEELARNFTTGRDKQQNAYELQQIGAQGANALRVANVRQPGAPTAQQENEVHDSIGLLDQLMGDPALATAVGPVDAYIGKGRDLAGVTRFENLHNQLIGKLSLAQAGKLKGQGQISDKERAMLASAASALSRNLSEADYKAELGKIRGQFQRMLPGGAAPLVAGGGRGPAAGGGVMRARDPQGQLHEAPAGTALPAGWKLE